MVARFAKTKDQQTLLYAFKNFLDHGKMAKLIFVGDGHTKKYVRIWQKSLT